jgi:2-amino-4-hydroxy-6-hydroxymethyldihydropteridine diphosphokinase
MENKAYLLLGSNLGNREKNLDQSLQLLKDHHCNIVNTSSIYQTAAWGLENQPDFLNQVIEISTSLSAFKLLDLTQQIEQKMGRIRTIKYGARTLDIDILYFNNDIIASENLVIPHPQLQNRRFTLIPLVEIAPNFIHPGLGINSSDLLKKCEDQGLVSLFKNNIAL